MPGKTALHESISGQIVEQWSDIKNLLEAEAYNPQDISRIISGVSTTFHTALLHSELDADRLDYLLRDATFTGVAYGNIELDHIVSTLNCTKNNGEVVVGVTKKALHAVEHYMLARYFMYTQVVYYPKIYYLENMLQEIYEYLIETKDKDTHIWNIAEVRQMISDNNKHSFYDFNDHTVFFRVRTLHDKFDKKGNLSDNDFVINESIKLLLSGNLPQPIVFEKRLIDFDKPTQEYRHVVEQRLDKVREQFNLPKGYLFYSFEEIKPTKLHLRYSPDRQPAADEREEALKSIDENGRVGYFIADEGTILSQIAGKKLFCFYLFANPYILQKKGLDEKKLIKAFRKEINLNFI